jgi:tetratricopeptide (TPR) repeat protein
MGYARDRRRMLATVRDEALDRLRDAGELEATLARQTAYYVKLAPRYDRALRGHGQDKARDTLDVEVDNLRDVLDRLLASGDAETAAGITAALGDYWYLRGNWAEARRWVDRCVAATLGSRSLARARVLRSHANQAGFSGIAERMTELDEALAIAREHGSAEDEIWTLLFIAGATMSAGGDDQRRALAEADRLIDQLDDPWIRAVRRSYVAATDVTLVPADAHKQQLRAHREFLALGDRAWAGRCLWFSGSIARRHLDLTTAEVELERAIDLCESVGDRAATAHARASLTRAAFARDAPEAGALFEQSVEELASIGDAHCADSLRTAMASRVGAR